MAVFSTKQVRQLYVANRYADGTTVPAVGSNTSVVGDLGVKTTGEGLEKFMYFQSQGKGGVVKSDYINVNNIDYVKAVKAADMATPFKVVEVTLDSDVNSGAPITGQDYILRINFRQFYGMSDEDQYFKDAAVHVTSAITDAEDFFTAMVDALNKSFSRELGATATSNPYLSFAVSGSGSSAKLVITEKEQPYNRGLYAKEKVYFDVFPTTVYDNGDDVIWGEVTDATPAKANWVVGTNAVGNGPQIADMEYFYMGERGDRYRAVNFPNYVPTEYMVDSSAQYNVFEVHYHFTDTGVNSYKTEKDITIVVPLGASGSEYTAINAILGAFRTATGITNTQLPDLA